MSDPVVTIFKLLGRQAPKNPGVGEGQTRFDLLIQPMMVREGSDGNDQGMAKGLAQAKPVVQPAMAAAQPGQKKG